MAKVDSRTLKGDALSARASELGIALEDFRDADNSLRETELRQRIRQIELYSADFHIGTLLIFCIAAFVICGLASWLAVHLLWHAYA